MIVYTQENRGVWLLHNGRMMQFSSMDTVDNAHGVPSLGSKEHGIPVSDLERLLERFPDAAAPV